MEERTYLRTARARLVEEMDQGATWQEAAAAAGLLVSRATAYRIWLRAWREGPDALDAAGHGHPAKLCAPIPEWLVAHCRAAPYTPSRALQTAIPERFGITISVRHLNRSRPRSACAGSARPSQKNSSSTTVGAARLAGSGR